MKTLLGAILFVLLFGGLGVLVLLGFAIANWGTLLLLFAAFIFRDQIKATVERATGAPSTKREGE